MKIFPGDIHGFDLGEGRPFLQPRDQLLDFFPLSLAQDLHTAVPEIPDPAGDAQGTGPNPRVVPEKDPLDTAADQDSGARFHGTRGYVNMAGIRGKYGK